MNDLEKVADYLRRINGAGSRLAKHLGEGQPHSDMVATVTGLSSLALERLADCREARAAVAELIERDRVAQEVFDCILRGLNDTSGELGYRSLQYTSAWMKSWAKALLVAGFRPTNPEAGDIKRALALVGAA